MAKHIPNPSVRAPQVFHTAPDGRIVKAPRCGDNAYASPKSGWRVTTDTELAEARKRAATPSAQPTPAAPTAKPSKEI